MKKRILSILLLCCMVLTMVLTMLPTTAFAAGELPDVKLSVPTTFDKTVDLTKQNKELKIKDSKTYLIKGSADPNWYFQYRIKIDGKNNTPHIFLDGVRLQAPKDGPAIELYGGASACLYFIGGDSELIGTENFAALQKNKTDGYLRVLVRTGTKLTCKGGTYGAGIGGSKVGIKKFSQGHGVNLHFGSLATGIYGGEILATSGVYGAGIGGGQGGVGEWIYVYSGKLTATSVSQGAGIGGGQGGPGRFIYIRGGTVVSSSRSAGAGIGSGDQDGLNEREDAHHIEISGGAVLAFSNYAGAGIGGGRDGSGCDISITGGVVQAQGYFGAGIGGGMNGDSWNILIKDTTLTALAFPLYPSSDYTELSASAVGRGSNRTHYMSAMKNQEDLLYEENIKIGASDGKSVRLSATGWQWHRSQGPYEMDWGTTTELLIPNENGRVDLQRLSLPYAYNYGRVISKLELRCVESTCSHEFGWANRDGCHIWACKNCGARDPAAEMSKQNGKHIPGDWSNQEQFCTVCGHVLERDTKAPVMETLTDGESYTVEDTLDGKPGAYTFTVSDPAASGETSSGVKSVTINGVPQDGPTYRLPAPDGGNNDAGAEYTVVATDNAGNETTATVRTYRRHHEHSYSDWSKDGTSHWHECTDYDCPNRNKSIKDKAAHDYTDDADTICNVCGYERTVTPPAPAEYTITVTSGGNGTASTSHAKAVAGTEITLTATPNTGYHFKEWQIVSGNAEVSNDTFIMPAGNVTVKPVFEAHSFTEEHVEEQYKKSSADCTHNDVYYKTCSCGAVSATETFELPGTALNHDWAEATCTEPKTCRRKGCGATDGNPLGHDLPNDWSRDENKHWHECKRCHAEEDSGEHEYGDDNICDICGYDKTVPHTHSLTLVSANNATCTKDGNKAYYTCDGCDMWFEDANGSIEIADKTAVIIPATGHAPSESWKFDKADHWKDCTNTGCGTIIEGSKAAHTESGWIIDTAPTYFNSGTQHKECTVCHYVTAVGFIPAKGGDIEPSDPSGWTPNPNLPATGDDNTSFIWIALLIICASTAAGTVIYGRRKKQR